MSSEQHFFSHFNSWHQIHGTRWKRVQFLLKEGWGMKDEGWRMEDERWGKESESRGKQIPTEHQRWNNACLREFSTASQCPTGSVQFSTACTHSPLLLYKYDHYVEVICLHFYVSTTVTTVYFYPIFYPMVTWPLLAIRLSLSRDLGLWYHSNSCINRRK